MTTDALEGSKKILGDGSLNDVTTGAGLERLTSHFGGIVLSEDEHFRGGRSAADQRSGFEAVKAGHTDVHDYDVGGELAGFINGIVTINGFTTDFEIGLTFDKGANAAANDFVVIDD